jgi:hypothetical protein
VDAPNNTLTITQPVGESTYTLAKDAAIELDGKPGPLAGLPAGADVTLSQFTDATTARSLQASGRWYYGAPVKAVDAEKNTITIADKEGVKTFAVAEDACVAADGKPCRLAGVPVGSFVCLGLAVDQTTVRVIGAEGPQLGECGGSLVKAVDAEKRTITFDDKAAASVAGKTFTVAKDANVVIEGKPGQLSEVPAGAYVNLTLSVDQQTALQVRAQGPAALCDCGGSLVKAVDAEKGTITFDDKARAEVAGKTFAVAKDAFIVIDGKLGTLAGLSAGSYVNLRLSLDQQTARQVHAHGPSVSGVVKAVDTQKSTVTVEDTTFPVAKDAVIVIDGKVGPLAGLPAGAAVTLSLHVDQKTIGMIQTKAP